MKTTQSSPHFTLEELTHSEIALRRGLDNKPAPAILDNLNVLASGLERVRGALNAPIIITSAYRSPEVNAAVGGSEKSQHMQGFAADFTCPRFGDPLDVCVMLAARRFSINFDQLIHEGRWVHISFVDHRTPRLEILTAHFEGGKVRYSKGLASE